MQLIARRRIAAQQIARHDFSTPADVVRWLGAVQAQDYAGAKWAVGLRLPPGATDAAIQRALDEGAILRTHVMRWTWQLVAPEDARWMIALVAARLMKKAERRHRELGLDARTIRRSNAALGKALAGGNHLARAELARVLARARISPEGPRLSHLLACAELDAIAISGPLRGKQATWALFDERVPSSRAVDARDAAAELAFRYARSRGPVSAADFAWWSGLPAGAARDALEATSSRLETETIGGRKLWHAATKDAPAPAASASLAEAVAPASLIAELSLGNPKETWQRARLLGGNYAQALPSSLPVLLATSLSLPPSAG